MALPARALILLPLTSPPSLFLCAVQISFYLAQPRFRSAPSADSILALSIDRRMSFDDLAFPNQGVQAARVSKRCPACEEERMVAQTEWVCPTCGERLLQAAPSAGFGGAEGQGNAMLRQLMSSMASASSSIGGAGAGSGGDAGSGEDGAQSLAAQLQSLFIPSLNSTYAQMAAAQQGLNIDELMTRLLQESSLKTATPASKAFIEGLKERPLVARDFLQVYLRFQNLPEFTRDVFPTVASFGGAAKYIDRHAAQQAEEKTAEAATTAAAEAATVAASAAPAPSSAEAPVPGSSAAAAAPAAIPAADPPKAASAPLEHSTGALLVSSPLTLAPPLRNSAEFRGRWILCSRGQTSFVAKARQAQDLLAKGIVVVQTESDEKGWPFVMSDTTRTSGDIIIPAVMISQSDGAALQDALAKRAAASSVSSAGPPTLTLLTRERPLACCICREDFELGHAAAELPCHHFYCLSCITPWLQSRANCPLCRFALPVDGPKQHVDPPGPDSNQAQLRRDMYT